MWVTLKDHLYRSITHLPMEEFYSLTTEISLSLYLKKEADFLLFHKKNNERQLRNVVENKSVNGDYYFKVNHPVKPHDEQN